MDFLTAEQVYGDMITLKRTNPRHLNAAGKVPGEETQRGTGFQALVTQALNEVNDLQQQSTSLVQQMLVDPESVDVHDITIAMAKANTSLSITKSIVERVIRAYSDIINIR
ncbi:MAG: flagellar hook-basal body complex protein FliE [Spirochaetes bacterium]|nr:MAG: flagellar hook-basal body complex protein FliE [Spirochaetota bacterium]